MKVGKKLLSWDTCDITEAAIANLIAEAKADGEEMSDEHAHELVWSDSDSLDFEWEYVTDWLSEIMGKKNKGECWKANVTGFGWLNQSGVKFFRAKNGRDFLREILPDTDCTFHIHNFGRGLAIQNFHHDSPCGNEWYYILPCSEKTMEDNS